MHLNLIVTLLGRHWLAFILWTMLPKFKELSSLPRATYTMPLHWTSCTHSDGSLCAVSFCSLQHMPCVRPASLIVALHPGWTTKPLEKLDLFSFPPTSQRPPKGKLKFHHFKELSVPAIAQGTFLSIGKPPSYSSGNTAAQALPSFANGSHTSRKMELISYICQSMEGRLVRIPYLQVDFLWVLIFGKKISMCYFKRSVFTASLFIFQ